MFVLCFLFAALSAAAQSELVIVKEATKQYHRPACPAIRDGRGVVAMSRAQAEARGYKAHESCDPANGAAAEEIQPAPASPQAKPPAKPPAPVYVFVSPGDNRYHRENCRVLAADRTKVTVEQAAASRHWPCRVCKPPIRMRVEPAVPLRFPRG
jgi:methylphosphotriester-DNA--protein-cysteine methyltransferase